jgi:hypothetical protein
VGLVAFLVFAIIVCVIAYAAVWLLGYLAPGHPGVIDRVIWVLAVVIIVWKLLAAMGVLGHDIMIPRV